MGWFEVIQKQIVVWEFLPILLVTIFSIGTLAYLVSRELEKKPLPRRDEESETDSFVRDKSKAPTSKNLDYLASSWASRPEAEVFKWLCDFHEFIEKKTQQRRSPADKPIQPTEL